MRAVRRALALVGITAVIALLASMAYLVATGGEEGTLSSQNDDWRGLSEASDQIESMGYEVRPLFTTCSLLLEDDAPETTLFISLGPERPYTKTEIHALRKFYSGGGKLIVADDTTTSNRLSSRFDVNFQKGQLYDENYEKHPDFVKIDVNWGDFSGTVLMNRPGALTHKNLRVIASSSPSAWLDKNGNGMMDPENISGGESPSSKTVAVLTDPDHATLGTGCALFISDPSMFMNEMLDLADNRAFLEKLVEFLLPRGGRVIIDDSVHVAQGLLEPVQAGSVGLAHIFTDINMKIIVGSLAVIIVIAMAYLFEPPERFKHVVYLDRTGVAELIDLGLAPEDMTEIKKVLLDKVRTSHGMSVSQFQELNWDQLKDLIDDERLYRFVRNDRKLNQEALERIMLEVNAWRMR